MLTTKSYYNHISISILTTMKSKIISILFTIVILDLLGFGIIIPILPVLFIKTQFNLAILHQLFPLVKQEYILYGLIVAAYPFAQFFSAPILGQLSDKYGRKQILFYCLAATSLSYFLAVLGIRMTSFPILLLSRVLGGIMGGNIAIAQAVAADITEVKDRTRVYGLLGAAFGIGFILGPYLGGKLSDSNLVSWFHLDTPFLMAGLLSFVSVVVTWLFLPETHPYEKRQLKLRFGQSISDIKAALSHKRLNTLFLVGFLFQFAFTMFVSFFGVLLFKRYSFTQVSIGEYFAFAGLWIAITQIFLTKFISRVLGNKAMLAFGLLGCCTMTFLLLPKVEILHLYVITALFAVTNGLTQTGIISLLSINNESSSQGKVLGINASLYALAQSIPPAISGIIATAYSVTTPIMIAGFIMALSFIYYIGRYKAVHD